LDMLTTQNKTNIRNLVSDNDDPNQDYFTVMNSHIMTNFEAQIELLFDVYTVNSFPSLAPVIQSSSTWNYDVPALSDSSPFIIAQNDDQVSSSNPAGDHDTPGNSDQSVLKPVRFLNNGFEPVTVVIESYEPAAGETRARSTASVVVNPDSNSSAYMELPTGTYTFCYYWQLDEDLNNDDYFDYNHRITKAITINQNSSNNPKNATLVTLNPDNAVSSPNGKCGEVVEQQLGLSAEEKTNEGTHNYRATCKGADWCEGKFFFQKLHLLSQMEHY